MGHLKELVNQRSIIQLSIIQIPIALSIPRVVDHIRNEVTFFSTLPYPI